MYKCEHCGLIFDEYNLDFKNTTYEDYFGCPIGSNTLLRLPVCPNCHSEEIDEYYEDEEEENDD